MSRKCNVIHWQWGTDFLSKKPLAVLPTDIRKSLSWDIDSSSIFTKLAPLRRTQNFPHKFPLLLYVWARWVQPTLLPASLTPVLILPHLILDLPDSLTSSGFPTEVLSLLFGVFLVSRMCGPKILHERQKVWNSSWGFFILLPCYLFRTYNIFHSTLFQPCQFIYILLGQKPSCHYLLQTLTYLDLSVFVYETGGQNFNFFKHARKSICSVVIVRIVCFNI